MIRGTSYNARLEALLQNRISEIDSNMTAPGAKSSEIIAERAHEREARNFSLDREELGLWIETQIESDSERLLLSTSQGNVLEIFADGSTQWKTTGDFVVQVDGSLFVKRGNTTVSITDGNVAITSTAPVTLTTPHATVTGGILTVQGNATVNPTEGPFCAIPNCIFSGTPHRGTVVNGT